MGLFNFFSKRRERESALAGSQIEDLQAQVVAAQAQSRAQGASQTFQVNQGGEVSGLEALGMLASMFGRYGDLKAQGVTVDSQVIDMRGTGLREEIMGVMAAHGVDASTKEGREIQAPEALQRDIMAVLARAGLNVEAGQFPTGKPQAAPSEPEVLDPKVPQIRNPLDR